MSASFRNQTAAISLAQLTHFGTASAVRTGTPGSVFAAEYFECRVGLKLRLVLRARRGVLYFITAGNHDDVEAFIKSR